MRSFQFAAGILLLACGSNSACRGEELLFEDSFDSKLSSRWEVVGLQSEDYRIRDGGLEIRVQQIQMGHKAPMIRVNLPFKTEELVTAAVDVTPVDQPLGRNEFAGLSLVDADGPVFSVRKVNIDGFFLFAPGEVDFIGEPGSEGDPSHYTVKYWPADKTWGPLRILIRQHYAHFQVGPSTNGKYRTFFHSAIRKADGGMGFGLMAAGASAKTDRWVRFDNMRVTRD